ncbi:MAG TPA: prolyl oligopeptidase family serine peptidase, partial [Gemmatimonadaceae bacterium]|nr:prolyl oligopeptidase family serine peptidase [Gemmatimonadaceae bacterium]
MLLGWHYMYYYSNAYAMNQYLASRGFVVMTVNYRLGIGYGHDFHHPPHAGPWGAAEYQDVLAAGRHLASLPNVDPKRVGIWGGSYGGYLGALSLARNSDVFATAVDLHGVHDWVSDIKNGFEVPPWRYEKGDVDSAKAVAWRSSPVSSMATWKSPVLLIQGDDDRNVRFSQTVDLTRRLDAAGVKYELLVFPDEIHDFLMYATWVRADSATSAYLEKMIGMK